MIAVSQINLHRSKDAAAMLAQRMATTHTGISLIQEPWVVKGVVRGLGAGCRLVVGSSVDRPRACIALKGMSGVPLPRFCFRDMAAMTCVVDMEGTRTNLVVASAYFPHDVAEVPPPEVQELVEHCRARRLPLILGCDANAHHTVWGSTDINARGEDLFSFIAGSDLEVANVGNEPTFRNAIRGEVLDLTLVSFSIKDFIKEWKVSDEPSLSDHATIEFKLGCSVRALTPRRLPRSTDWSKYRLDLGSKVREFPATINMVEEVDGATEQLTEMIVGAFERSSRVMNFRGRQKMPWWNDNLARLKMRVGKAFNRAKNSGCDERFAEWRTLRNQLRKEVRHAKASSWKAYCDKIEAGSEAARLNRMLASNPEAWVGALKLDDGGYTNCADETLLFLMKSNFSGCIRDLDWRRTRRRWVAGGLLRVRGGVGPSQWRLASIGEGS